MTAFECTLEKESEEGTVFMLEPCPRMQGCREGVEERAACGRPGRSQDGEGLRAPGQECEGIAEGLRVVCMQVTAHTRCRDRDGDYLVTFGRKRSWSRVAGGG